MNLFDASALLCYLMGEPGADVVKGELGEAAACSAANWSETAQQVLAQGWNWELARGLLLSYGLLVEPVLAVDAESAARRWRPGTGLSLADRICLSTGERLGAIVWTADLAWGHSDRVRQVR